MSELTVEQQNTIKRLRDKGLYAYISCSKPVESEEKNMLNKEEFKKQLVRMWDSVRTNRHKGSLNCSGVYCNKCPLESYCKEGTFMLFNSFEVMETVENWAKDHPVKTNMDKFEEIFGFEAPLNRCIKNNVSCSDCEYCDAKGSICRADERFWFKEYKKLNEEECDD